MFPYILLLCIILIGFCLNCVLNKKESKKFSGFLCFCLTIFCIVLVAFRSLSVGTDTVGYYKSFESITLQQVKDYWSNFDIRHTEIFYYSFTFILKSIGLTFDCLLLFEAIIYVIPVSLLIRKFSPNVFFSFLLFVGLDYFFFSLTGLRQSIALGFVALAILKIYDKKIVPSILLILCAVLFHTSALVAIPIVVLRFIPFNKKTAVFFLCSAIAVYLLKNILISFIQDFAIHESSIRSIDTGGTGTYLLFIFILFIASYLKLKKKKDIADFLINLLAVSVVIFPALQFNPTAFRIHYYYSFLIIILLPISLSKISNITIRTPFYLLIGTVVVYYMFSNPIQVMGINPYTFK